MADRTVSVKLKADIGEYTAQLAKAAAATRGLGGEVEKNVRPGMTRAGEESGGILARGIRSGVIRNSPLIVAGVAAALAAGAPAVLAGATALFGGIGAIAAAQNSEVREAWTELGHEIRDGAVQDVAVLVPVYERMADKIGTAFQRMRPEIRDAFEASAPHIERFTEGVTGAAENALPGLVRAVERGGPVIDGLATLMEDVGTGLSDFLDAMSDNSGAAGQALEGLGDALGAALPLLGELLGTGSEIAADVLPVVAGGLSAVHGVVKALGPALPPLVTGFIAFKAASTAAGYLNTFSVAAQRATVASTTASTAVGGFGKAVPLIAATMAAFTVSTDTNEDRVSQWAQTLAKGGKAADDLKAKVQEARDQGFFEDVFGGTSLLLGDLWDDDHASNVIADFEAAEEAARDLAGAEDELASSTDAATAAMAEQAAQAAAAANSDLAYRMSVDATEGAVSDLATAIAEHGAASEEASDAALGVEQAMLRQAEAARQSAFDTSTATSEAGKNAEADAAMLAELLKLRDTMGSSFPASLNTTIGRLQGATNAGMVAAAQFSDLGLKILAVPNSKTVIVSSTTPEQIRQLETLGYKVRTLPDGTVEVTAQTATAEAALNQVARDRSTVVTAYIRTIGSVQAPAGVQRFGLATGGGIENGRVQHFDIGGSVRGPGGPTADQVPAMLSNGEHVWTAAEVNAAGGQAAMAAMRRAVLSGREFSGASSRGGGGGADINGLATKIASILASRPTVGSITTQRNETGFELAEKLTFTARTGG